MKLRKEIWNKVKIENVASIIGGGTPSRSNPNYFKGDILWIGPTEIPKDRIRIISETNEKLTSEAIQKSSAKILPIGTILFTTRATVGEVAIAGKEIATSQSLENFVCNPDKIDNWYLAYWLKGNQRLIHSLSAGTTFKGITRNILAKIEIPLPPLEEQKQIAALFQSIETAMEQVDGQEKNLKALRKSLINKLTKQKPKFGNLLTKSNYKEYSIGDLAVEVPDRTDNPQKTGIEKFIGLEDFESGELTIQRFSSTEKLVSAMKLCKQGDVLFARRNAYLKRASLTDFDAVCSGDVIVMRAKEKIILPKFLILIMNTDEFWEFAISNAAGTMSKRVKWRDLATYSLELPDLKIQEKILEVFNQLEATLTQLKQQKATLKNLKQKLLNEILG